MRQATILASCAGIFVGFCACDTPSLRVEAALEQARRSALLEVLEDERRTEGLYAAIVEKFGARPPFPSALAAERQHQRELEQLFVRYGFPIPERQPFGVVLPETLEEACQLGLESERESIALIDRQLEVVDEKEIEAAFLRLRASARERHLPAFQRCAAPVL
jgi:hypothetical protein